MPSHQPPSLLVLSNGHGEDVIALAVIAALRRRRPDLAVSVLPLVGTGEAFRKAEEQGLLRRVGPRRHLPSGGFSNQSLSGLVRDLGAGLVALSWRQWRLVRSWGAQGHPVLAVGDLLPLLLAWSGGGPFAFLGTPKSDYTWASPPPAGWAASPLADRYHRCKGSEWDPWEWALMASRRCRLVALRDRLTARGLRRHGVPAEAPGNPMMDGLGGAPLPAGLQGYRRVLLLPGSRMPEALSNLRRLLAALPPVPAGGAQAGAGVSPWLVLLATGRDPGAAELDALLTAAGFRPGPSGVGPEAVAADPGARAGDRAAAVRGETRPGGASAADRVPVDTPLAETVPAATGPGDASSGGPAPRPGVPAGAAPTAVWHREGLTLWLGQGRFASWAPWAEVGLATAGTATEQLVGLGIPALSLPGPGPQFQAGFARRQSRLLGGAVQPLRSAADLQRALLSLLDNGAERQRRGRVGRRRMGEAGGSDRLAELIDRRLLHP